MSLLALDIGGANLKVADGKGFALARRFPLWRRPDELSTALQSLLSASPPAMRLAVTMTGELADCFSSKADGVTHILTAVAAAAPQAQVRVYLTDGRLVDASTAAEVPWLAASSNWQALAAFALRYCDKSPTLLVDVGSTTTDLIPLRDGRVDVVGRTDPERLIAGELVYTGVERTPLFALLPECTLGAVRCPTAAEWFATASDAYVLLGDAPEEPQCTDTADGRPLTKASAHRRIARLICGDMTYVTREQAEQIAREFRSAQVEQVVRGIARVVERLGQAPRKWLLCGQGEFLGRTIAAQFLEGTIVLADVHPLGIKGPDSGSRWSGRAECVASLASVIGPEVSRCAPAHALATLAMECDAW